MIQIYYGTGKGKTSAAIGAAIRACGSGMRVLFVPFLKNGDSSECSVLQKTDGIDLLLPNSDYVLFEPPVPDRLKARSDSYAELLFEKIAACADNYPMIVLDEALDILQFDYVAEEAFLQLLNALRETCELILTGHVLPDSLADLADYVSRIDEEKHPFSRGIPARRGIEYR